MIGPYLRKMRSIFRSKSEQDLGRRLGRAAVLNELDGSVEIRFAGGQPLRERKGVSGFHQDVQAPALDLRSLAAVPLKDLSHLAHRLPRFVFQ